MGVLVGTMIVIASVSIAEPGWSVISHSECETWSSYLGNVTAWFPASAVAAPYLGWESGSVTIWGETPTERSALTQDTMVTDGNVSVFYVSYSSLSVYRAQTVTAAGPGLDAACTAPLSARFSPLPARGLNSGGISWIALGAARMQSDRGLPTALDGAQLCATVENSSYAGCAVGAQFDLNFVRSTGTIDTCGSSESQVLHWMSYDWPVSIPYEFQGKSYSVPVEPSGANGHGFANGTYSFYNYTFPAGDGVWQYDDLSETSSTGAGLVFSYSPCP